MMTTRETRRQIASEDELEVEDVQGELIEITWSLLMQETCLYLDNLPIHMQDFAIYFIQVAQLVTNVFCYYKWREQN